MGQLDGKVAIVTGAGRGIGRAEAILLAAEGARVVVNDLDTALEGTSSGDGSAAQHVVDEIVAAGGTALANGDDVGSWAGAQHLVEQAVSEFGDLNVVVNNAGVVRDSMSFNMDEEAFDLVVKVHLKGHFAVSRFAAAYWRSQIKAEQPVYGRIINTTSEAGLWGTPGQANYAAAKGGIYSMTLTMARELERYRVTVNAIAPRARTRMTETLGGGFSGAPDEGFDDLAPENIAPVVGWLASEAAAKVSGQVFVVTGGRVHLIDGFRDASSIVRNSRWTVAELAESQAELFGERRSRVPQFGIGF